MTKTSMSFKGMDTLQAVLQSASPRATEFLVNAMDDVSQDIFAESQKQVPVRHGVLKASGHVDDPEVNDNHIVINIGYGGPAGSYALFVHENLSAHHTPPTKAKFLEDPMKLAMTKLTERLQGRMEGAILGSYPGSPANAQQAEASSDTKAGYGRKAPKDIASTIARSKAMSAGDITRALKEIRTSSGSPRRMHRG